MPSTCPTLEYANQSRRRAWRQLQRISKLLAAHVEELPPPSKPPNFEIEGQILCDALKHALTVEGIKPYLSNTLNDGKYPLRVLDLNRAVGDS